jgi:hypothetical protein
VPNLFLGYAYRKYYQGMFVRKPNLWHWNLCLHHSSQKVCNSLLTWISYRSFSDCR